MLQIHNVWIIFALVSCGISLGFSLCSMLYNKGVKKYINEVKKEITEDE